MNQILRMCITTEPYCVTTLKLVCILQMGTATLSAEVTVTKF